MLKSRLHRSRRPASASVAKDSAQAGAGELLHENPWFAVRNRDGYFTIEHHLAQVVVLPLVENRAVVMVRVRRPVVRDVTLELPAGSAEKHETPVQGAARELAEETGIRANAQRLVQIARLAVMPNRTPDFVHVFRADLSQAEYDARSSHDAEVSGVELVPLEDVGRLVASGAIYLALPVAVLGMHLFSGMRTGTVSD
jgi:ADP-ribose pyrophosphatase